ncbi:hypothetical protein RFI_03737 [Reticulomyxa filosa]|uniref:TauD/TfdA-like domain-containing protein n=1 Tax=Reticulomyxa filosa TaxID=46433 RepID=X6P4C6_RETFI|nr:hypothetical protein RFI_03737 [Reticulomyxa filosa]|eukprot:ETO33370.1 hypothetical protein RFI_03737 [Reticulomyxa filosa]
MKISPSVKVSSMYEKEGVLYVTWSDNHKGFIPLADLDLTSNEVVMLNGVEQSLKKLTKKRSSNGYSEKINASNPYFLWDSNSMESEEKSHVVFEFNHVMKDTKCLLQLIEAFEKYGVVQVRNCFGNFGACEILAKRIGMIRTTIYGDTFVITNNPEVTALESRVYTNANLPPQTDLPYYELSPEVIVFHSIEKAEFGGESFFVDGFHCASLLRQHAPKHFDVLSNVRVPFRKNFLEKGFDMISNHFVIECNPDTSAVERIHFDEGNRQSLNWDLPVENKKDFYDALRSFRDLIFDEKNRFEFMMDRGDITIFDNRRVLHGSKAFVGKRVIEGCYLDWQSVHGNYRSQMAKISK